MSHPRATHLRPSPPVCSTVGCASTRAAASRALSRSRRRDRDRWRPRSMIMFSSAWSFSLSRSCCAIPAAAARPLDRPRCDATPAAFAFDSQEQLGRVATSRVFAVIEIRAVQRGRLSLQPLVDCRRVLAHEAVKRWRGSPEKCPRRDVLPRRSPRRGRRHAKSLTSGAIGGARRMSSPRRARWSWTCAGRCSVNANNGIRRIANLLYFL